MYELQLQLHVFFETSVDLSNYYIECVFLVFCIFFLLYS